MFKMFAMTVPIVHGKEGDWKAWIENIKNNHMADFVASRKRYGVLIESQDKLRR